MIIKILISTTILVAAAAYTFESVDQDTPMIITQMAKAQIYYDTFKILFFVNITQYNHGAVTIANCIKTLEEFSPIIDMKTYNISVDLLRYRLNWLSEDEKFLNQYGTIDDAQGWSETVNKVVNHTLTHEDLVKTQSMVIESSLNYNKEFFLNIDRSLNEIKARINNVEVGANIETKRNNTILEAQSFVQLTQMALDEQARVYRQIRSTLNNDYYLTVMELESKEAFVHHLREILLSSDKRLPINPWLAANKDILDILRYSTISSNLFENKLMIKVEIPTTQSENFRLYKAVPIPMRNMIASTYSTYFLLNTEMTKYIEISQKDMANKIMISKNEMLFSPSSIIFLNRDLICEWKILTAGELTDACNFSPYTAKNAEITDLDNDAYFISTNKEITLWETCDNDVTTTSLIKERGIIQVNPKCSLKSRSFIIMPHETTRINATKIMQTKLIYTRQELDNTIKKFVSKSYF